MEQRTRTILAILAIIAVGALILSTPFIISFFFEKEPDRTVGELEEGPLMLGNVEISEYKGEKLGSKEDFRENSILGPQSIDAETYRLRITGLVEEEKSYSYEELLEGFQHYRKVVALNCVEGWSVRILWDGLLVRDVIEEAGPQESGKVLIFKAEDGYTTSLPVEFFYDNDILMAYGMNNVTLDAQCGFPFQLVAEMKWGYKWIKWITEIEVSDDIDYKGYWEEVGYSNTGDLDDPSWVGD
ncbi:MAG: molybdopterin-dependent oxidoreductase [Thermoplasmatota archaeon]